jgi:hypothetical protein
MHYFNIYTVDNLLKDVPVRWKNHCKRIRITNSEEIYQELLKAKNLQEIDQIIGNPYWTKYLCNICQCDCNKVVELRNDFLVCFNCYNKIHLSILNFDFTSDKIVSNKYINI